MRFRIRIATWAFTVALAYAGCASAAPFFFVAFTPDGSSCSATVVPFSPFTSYIFVVPGSTLPGVTGAEFRVDGFDPSWFNTVTPNPLSNVALGNPIQGGCTIAFPACQGSSFTPVLLYTIQSIALAPVTPRTLPILAHTTPSNPNFQCPLVVNCNPPIFSLYCGAGAASCVNRQSIPCWCEFAVERKSWSQIKQLYAMP